MLLKSIQLLSISLPLAFAAFGNTNVASQVWVKDHSIPFASLESLEKSPNLNELDRAVENKRILMLGEPDHYITEKLKYQLALIKRYYEKGFNSIGAEMGRSDARRINRFLQTGDESALNSVALFGNKSEILVERDLPKGLLQIHADPETESAKERWRKANMEFWRQIRAFNLSQGPDKKHLELFGFDIDVLPGGAYKDIENLLGSKDGFEVETLKSLLQRPKNETRNDELMRLKRAEQYIATKIAAFSIIYQKETLKDIRDSLRQLIESFEFINVAYANPDYQQWIDIAGKREKTMMWQMDDRLSRPGKIILIGHNSHLAKDSTTINLMKASSSQFAPMWPTIGTYLHQKLEKQMHTVWLLYGGGKRGAGPECPNAECKIEIKLGTINSLFLAASEQKPFLLSLSNKDLPAFLRQPVDIQFNGNVINSSILTNQCDSIIFVPEVHAIDRY